MSDSCDPMDCSRPGSSVHGILQARILEWVAMPASRGSSPPRDRTCASCLLHWQAGSLPLAPPGKPYSVYAAAAAKSPQSCPTLCDPIDGSPRGSPFPWDSPGKNTGVGCHFLLQCMKVKSESEVAQSCPTLSDPMDCSPPWDFPGKSTGVGCRCLLQGFYAVPLYFWNNNLTTVY